MWGIKAWVWVQISPCSGGALNSLLEPVENSGKKVSFEIAADAVEGPTHRTELALRQTTKENEVLADAESAKDPLVELEDKDIKEKAESTRVEKGKVAKLRVEKDRVDPTDTPKAKRQSRSESTNTLDPKQGEDGRTSPNSYLRGEASDKNPNEGSNNINHRQRCSKKPNRKLQHLGDPNELEGRQSFINRALTTSTIRMQKNQDPTRKL